MLGESIGANIIRKKPLIQNFVNCRRKKVFYPSNNLGIVFVWTNFQSVVQSLSFSAAVVYTLYTSGRNVKPPTSIRKSGENCLFLLQETFFCPLTIEKLNSSLISFVSKGVSYFPTPYVRTAAGLERGWGRQGYKTSLWALPPLSKFEIPRIWKLFFSNFPCGLHHQGSNWDFFPSP